MIEEAHEFLSDERIDKMPVLFQQVARIAKRGRKRWLGLCFVTQLPAHLPKQVLGLCNSFILHKLTDPQVVATLRRTVGGVDDGLWDRLPGLAPGQAVVELPAHHAAAAGERGPGPGQAADGGLKDGFGGRQPHVWREATSGLRPDPRRPPAPGPAGAFARAGTGMPGDGRLARHDCFPTAGTRKMGPSARRLRGTPRAVYAARSGRWPTRRRTFCWTG